LASKGVLAHIKKDLEPYVGERIRVKANKGRKKIMEREGILESIYPNIFIIKIQEGDHSERRISYTYADLLTETVELVICSRSGEETRIAAHSR